MTRRQFLCSAFEVGAAALGLTVLASCTADSRSPQPQPPGGSGGSGGSPDGGTTASSCTMNGTTVTIETNHGHVLVVSADDVRAGAAQTYHIQGTADHDHTVMLTSSHFAMLAANHAITVQSSTDAEHSHTIMIACA